MRAYKAFSAYVAQIDGAQFCALLRIDPLLQKNGIKNVSGNALPHVMFAHESGSDYQCPRREPQQQDRKGQTNGLRFPQSRALQNGDLFPPRWPRPVPGPALNPPSQVLVMLIPLHMVVPTQNPEAAKCLCQCTGFIFPASRSPEAGATPGPPRPREEQILSECRQCIPADQGSAPTGRRGQVGTAERRGVRAVECQVACGGVAEVIP